MHSTGQDSIASSMQSSGPPSGRMTSAFSSSSLNAKTSEHSSTQLSQPIHSSVSIITPTHLRIHLFLTWNQNTYHMSGYILFFQMKASKLVSITKPLRGLKWMIHQKQTRGFDCWSKNAVMNLDGLKIKIFTKKMIIKRPRKNLWNIVLQAIRIKIPNWGFAVNNFNLTYRFSAYYYII